MYDQKTRITLSIPIFDYCKGTSGKLMVLVLYSILDGLPYSV